LVNPVEEEEVSARTWLSQLEEMPLQEDLQQVMVAVSAQEQQLFNLLEQALEQVTEIGEMGEMPEMLVLIMVGEIDSYNFNLRVYLVAKQAVKEEQWANSQVEV